VDETAYAIRVRVELPFEEAKDRLLAELKAVGFGVQWRLDAQARLREAVGADFRRYMIYGACDPALAWKAFEQELEVGLMLPCTAIVYEDGGGSVIAVMDPVKLFGLAGNARLDGVAAEAHRRIETALSRIEGGEER
jgi:uncharacterized protein (DUF302 family)